MNSGAGAERISNESKLWANAFYVNSTTERIHCGVLERKQKITATNCAINTIIIERSVLKGAQKQYTKGAPMNTKNGTEKS